MDDASLLFARIRKQTVPLLSAISSHYRSFNASSDRTLISQEGERIAQLSLEELISSVLQPLAVQKHTSTSDIVACFDYTLLPLSQLLVTAAATAKKSGLILWHERTLVATLDAMRYLIEACSNHDPNAFAKHICAQKAIEKLMQLISPYVAQHELHDNLSTLRLKYSDHLQESAIRTLKAIFSAINCQQKLIRNRDEYLSLRLALLASLESQRMLGAVGFIVSQLLDCSVRQNERSRRLAALETIDVIVNIYSCPLPKQPHGLSGLLSFVPGLLGSLHKVAFNQSQQGQKAKALSVHIFTAVVIYAFADTAINGLIAPKCKLSTLDDLRNNIKQSRNLTRTETFAPKYEPSFEETKQSKAMQREAGLHLEAKRTAEWLHTSMVHVQPLLTKLFSDPVVASHALVREQLVRSAALLLDRCSHCVSDCQILLCEFILGHTQDQLCRVSEVAIASLMCVRNSFAHHAVKQFRSHIVALPRVIRQLSSAKHESHLRLLTAYVNYFSDACVGVLTREAVELLQYIVQAAEIDYSAPHVLDVSAGSHLSIPATTDASRSEFFALETPSFNGQYGYELVNRDVTDDRLTDGVDRSYGSKTSNANSPVRDNNDSDHTLTVYRPVLKFLQNDTERMLFLHFLRCIGQRAARYLFPLLETLRNLIGTTPSAYIIINNIVDGAKFDSVERSAALVSSVQLILNDFMNSKEFVSASVDLETGISDRGANTAVILQLQGIGSIATLLQDEFEPYVMHLIYPLLQRVGDKDMSIRLAAMHALNCISKALSYSDIGHMIVKNSDYVIDAIGRQLRYSQGAIGSYAIILPRVLTTLLAHVGPSQRELLPMFEDIINASLDALFGLTPRFHEEIDYLSMLHATVDSTFRMLSADLNRSAIHFEQPLPRLFYQSSHLATVAASGEQKLLLSRDSPNLPYSVICITNRLQTFLKQFDEEDRETAAQLFDAENLSTDEFFKKVEANKHKKHYEEGGSLEINDDETGVQNNYEKSHADQEETLSREEQCVLHVLESCVYLLTLPTPTSQLRVLSIVKTSVIILSIRPRHLLPALAKLWPAFSYRLRISPLSEQFRTPSKSELLNETGYALQSKLLVASQQTCTNGSSHNLEPLLPLHPKSTATPKSTDVSSTKYVTVLLHALDVLETLSCHASRFLAQRFSTDVWPVMLHLLHSELMAIRDIQSWSDINVDQSPAFRILSTVLLVMSRIVSYPDLIYHHVGDMAHAALKYLQPGIPKILQQRAIHLYRSLMLLDSDKVWVALMSSYPHQRTVPTLTLRKMKSTQLLPQLPNQFSTGTDTNNDFSDFVTPFAALELFDESLHSLVLPTESNELVTMLLNELQQLPECKYDSQ